MRIFEVCKCGGPRNFILQKEMRHSCKVSFDIALCWRIRQGKVCPLVQDCVRIRVEQMLNVRLATGGHRRTDAIFTLRSELNDSAAGDLLRHWTPVSASARSHIL